MQTNNENDIDQHITTLLTDILAPTNYAEIKGVLKTVDLLADYVKLENVRTILESDVLFRENRDIAVMALDILRKMHDDEQDQESDTCETEVVDAVNEALGRAEAETITLSESTDDVEEVVAAITPEKTPEPAEVEATSVDATETEPEQVSHEALDRTEPETIARSESVDDAEEVVAAITPEKTPEPAEVEATSIDTTETHAEQVSQKSPETNTIIEIPVSAYEVAEDSFDSMDGQMLEPESEPAAQDSGFPGLPDDGGLPDSADSMDSQTPEIESELASPSVEFPGLPDAAEPPDAADLAGSPFDDDPDQMPAFPDDGDLSGSTDLAGNEAGNDLEQQWKQTVQRIKELKTRYVTK